MQRETPKKYWQTDYVEAVVPGQLVELYEDDDIIVVDKPHFLATMPRGMHYQQTALMRLRNSHENPEISPMHRLDRLTAGVLVFTKHKAVRGLFQKRFDQGLVWRTYEAIAPHLNPESWPVERRSRIEKTPGILAAIETDGEVNAITRVELLRPLGRDLSLYRLLPRTGKTHQLRVHMSALGAPIVGDPLYPEVQDFDPKDFSTPLQLLARSLRFQDPRNGQWLEFRSERELELPPAQTQPRDLKLGEPRGTSHDK